MAEEHGLTAARTLLLLRSASVSVFPFGARVEIIRMSAGRTIGSFVVAFRRAVNGCGLAAPAG